MNMEPRVLFQPLLDGRGLMRRVIVGDDMDPQHMRLAVRLVRLCQLRHLLVDLLQELDPFLRPVAFVSFRDHQAGRDVERREQVNGAMPDIVMRPLLRHAGHHRQYRLGPGWDLSRAWTWDFSSAHSTTACSGGFRYNPTTSQTFPANSGSEDSLKVSARCGLRWKAFQIRS